MSIDLDDLRRMAVNQSLFRPTTLKRALDKLGFVQADPIRAPARAQDLILRQRVSNYRAGDLDRRFAVLDVEEDVFINYGFVTRSLQAIMHPRPDRSDPGGSQPWPAERKRQAQMLLDFVRERGAVHPREVDDHFSHGNVENYWGGSSKATTYLLDAMHYRGMLRVARREAGIRIYAAHQHGPEPIGADECRARMDLLADTGVNIYAPLPATSLAFLLRRLRYAAPQWRGEITEAIRRARKRLSHARVDGIDWYWPAIKNSSPATSHQTVRLLAPFDPVVWDRDRFEMLWGWPYRFEAYTPLPKRKLGYYALPLLWRNRIIGWGNLSVSNGKLVSQIGYVESHPPRERAFKHELEAELDRMRVFLGLEPL